MDGFKKKKAGDWKVDEILLASGDAHDKAFKRDSSTANALSDHSKRLTNYYSNDDAILTMAVFYHGIPRVGQKGLPPQTESNHIDMYSTARYRKIRPDFDDEAWRRSCSPIDWWFEDDRFFKDAALTHWQAKGRTGLLHAPRPTRAPWR